MNKSSTILSIFLLLAGNVLSACSTSPNPQFYVLSPLSPPPQDTLQIGPKRLIGVGPITIPTVLQRKQIVTRTGDHQVSTSEFHLWAAPLQEAALETLTQNLSGLLPNDIIKAYPWTAYGEMDQSISVDIIRFETTATGNAELVADWTLMDRKNHTPLKSGKARISRRCAVNDHAAAVKALSETLQIFSRQLADVLKKTLK